MNSTKQQLKQIIVEELRKLRLAEAGPRLSLAHGVEADSAEAYADPDVSKRLKGVASHPCVSCINNCKHSTRCGQKDGLFRNCDLCFVSCKEKGHCSGGEFKLPAYDEGGELGSEHLPTIKEGEYLGNVHEKQLPLDEDADRDAFVVVPGEVQVPGTGITVQFPHGLDIRSPVLVRTLRQLPELIMQQYRVHKPEEE